MQKQTKARTKSSPCPRRGWLSRDCREGWQWVVCQQCQALWAVSLRPVVVVVGPCWKMAGGDSAHTRQSGQELRATWLHPWSKGLAILTQFLPFYFTQGAQAGRLCGVLVSFDYKNLSGCLASWKQCSVYCMIGNGCYSCYFPVVVTSPGFLDLIAVLLRRNF